MAKTANSEESGTTYVIDRPANPIEPAVPPTNEPDQLALDRILNELESGDHTAKVSIWRHKSKMPGQPKTKDQYLMTFTPSDFQDYGLDGIQADYGEGEYTVKIFDETGTLMHNTVYSVGPISPVRKKQIEAERKRQEQEDRQQNFSGGSNNNADLLSGFAQIARSMQEGFSGIASLLAQQAQQANNRRVMIEELSMYKSLFAPVSGAPGGPGVDPFAMAKSALDLLKQLGGGVNKESSTVETVLNAAEKFIPGFVEIAKAHLAAKGAASPQLPAPTPAQAAAALAAPNQGDPMLDPTVFVLKKYLPMLIEQAANDINPDSFAEMIVKQVPEQKVRELVARPDTVQFLASIDPRVNQFTPWFEELKQTIIEILTEGSQAPINPIDGISTLGGDS